MSSSALRVRTGALADTINRPTGIGNHIQESAPRAKEVTPMDPYQQRYQECERKAIAAGALKPQGMGERAAAGVMAANGQSWANSARAQARLREWTERCMSGNVS